MRVLFTGGGGSGTQALWELLQHRYDIHFADADVRRVNPIVPPDHSHAVPLACDAEFVNEVKRICRDLSVDVLVPGVDEELEQLAARRSDFGATTLLLPAAEFIRTMLDKFEFASRLRAQGIYVPRTKLLDDPEPWLTFPCIVKPRRGRGSRGVVIVRDASELATLRNSAGESSNKSVVQELATGTEYSVQVVGDGRQVVRAVFPARIISKRGITISAIGEHNEIVIDACTQIHEAVPSAGCYNVQGILDDDQRFLPFEINPRVSTTLCLALASGIDPIEILMSPPGNKGLIPFEAGIELNRFWHNSFTRPSTK